MVAQLKDCGVREVWELHNFCIVRRGCDEQLLCSVQIDKTTRSDCGTLRQDTQVVFKLKIDVRENMLRLAVHHPAAATREVIADD